jgi:hypothetical protein
MGLLAGWERIGELALHIFNFGLGALHRDEAGFQARPSLHKPAIDIGDLTVQTGV